MNEATIHCPKNINFKEFAPAWALCTNLKTVELMNVSKDYFEAMFSAPKRLLKSIKMQDFKNKEEWKMIIDKLPMNTGAIEHLDVTTSGTWTLQLNTFSMFIWKNRLLSHVRLHAYKGSQIPLIQIEMVGAFSKEPELKVLLLSSSTHYNTLDASRVFGLNSI